MAEKPTESRMEDAAAGPGAALALLGDRFVIDPKAPIPELDSPTAKAYTAEDQQDMPRPVYALVCASGLPVRGKIAHQLRGSNISGLANIIDFEAIFWPPAGQHCMIVILERPLGGCLMPHGDNKVVRIDEHDLGRVFLGPIAETLRKFSSYNLTHRSIRPSNIFFTDEKRQQVVLGECVTAPPGFNQPTVFETIERGLADPAGRGEGTVADDIYALGVSIVFVLLGYNPLGKASEDDILYPKIEHGSYAALCGNHKVPLSMLGPLRGMLSDNPAERWGLETLKLWTSGRQITPIQGKGASKANAPFNFAGQDHISPRTLARALSSDEREAVGVIRSGRLGLWLRRHMSKSNTADALSAIFKEETGVQSRAPQSDSYLVARACMVLDPGGPLRYKGLSFTYDGLGPTLAVELLRQGNNQLGAEVIIRDLPAAWLGMQVVYTPELSAWERNVAQLRGFLQVNGMGYGIERCLYELNPDMPCQSPLLAKHYVAKIGDILSALEEAAKEADSKAKPMDRHIAAFIATHFGENIDPHLKALAAPNEETFLIGMVSLLAFLQWRFKVDSLYGLASWVGGLLQPVVNTYHSRTIRRQIEREIPKLVRKGSLPDLFDLIDNPEKRREDISDFKIACGQFAEAEAEIKEIESGETADTKSMELAGQKHSSTVSVLIGMVSIVIFAIARIW